MTSFDWRDRADRVWVNRYWVKGQVPSDVVGIARWQAMAGHPTEWGGTSWDHWFGDERLSADAVRRRLKFSVDHVCLCLIGRIIIRKRRTWWRRQSVPALTTGWMWKILF